MPPPAKLLAIPKGGSTATAVGRAPVHRQAVNHSCSWRNPPPGNALDQSWPAGLNPAQVHMETANF